MLDITIIWLLPIVFIFHDFEEIIMMEAWLKRNENFLQNNFPIIGKRIISMYKNLSTASFTIAVAEEFLILVLSVILVLEYNSYVLWAACFIAFSIHLILHIFQWIVIRKYIPAIITSLLSLIYAVISFQHLLSANLFSKAELILITIAGLAIVAVNLFLAHKIAALFEKYLLKFSRTK